MYYTELASDDARLGVIVIGDSLTDICKDIMEWIKEAHPNGLRSSGLYERETQKLVGTVNYKNGMLIIDPVC